jgi:hypothetical protein
VTSRRLIAAFLLLPAALLGAETPQPSAPPSAQEELAEGVRQVREGEFEAALSTLDRATRRLAAEKAPAADVSRGYVYLAITYIGLAQVEMAKSKFLDALKADGALELSAREFPASIVDMFAAVKKESGAQAPSPRPAAAPVASAPAPRKGGSKLPLVLVGVGGAGALVAVAASKGGSGAQGPATSAAPTPAPTPNATFTRYFGAYAVTYRSSVSGCGQQGTFTTTLAGGTDGSGFTFNAGTGGVPETGTITAEGRFRTTAVNVVTEGTTDGTRISGTRTFPSCGLDFSGSR